MQHNRILVVDGSTVSRELIARSLSDSLERAEVTACGSAAEALRRLDHERFDLILTALLLPDRDGLDLCRAIRRTDTHHYTPVIVISSDANSRLLREGFDAGVTDYFDKSLGFQAFESFIRDFTERHAGLVGRVLYVEDSATAAALTQRILRQHGLQVTHTTNAEQALELLLNARDAGHEEFDIVITDFHLKGQMSGGDLLHALRAQYHYSQQELPVLVLTGNEDTRTQAEVFHAGANDFVNKPIVHEILMARVRSLLLIKHQFQALKRQADEIREMALTDGLTGLRNRRYLLERGRQYVDDDRHQPCWAMIIDLDHFKQINDRYGHLVGDRVLQEMGTLLQESFDDGVSVRYGGEEFAVLLGAVDPEAVQTRAERYRAAAEEAQPSGVPVTVSIGVMCISEIPERDLNLALALADKALYAAKDAGRNRVFCSDIHANLTALAR